MPKFNLKNYKKTDGDEHTDLRLEEHRSDAPEQITEKQLDDYRAEEQDQTIEKQLESKRTGGADRITEGLLEKETAHFDIKHRNAATYDGDMNKLEEQRLAGDPVEKEKYESFSDINKKMRWWEGTKSPDGLKLASKITKQAGDREDEDAASVLEDTITPEEEDQPADTSARLFDPFQEAFNGAQEAKLPVERITGSTGMTIVTPKDKWILKGKIPGIYMTLEFEPTDFNGNEDKIRREALREVLAVMPELGGLIDETDFSSIDDVAGTLKLRAGGPQFNILSTTEKEDFDINTVEGPSSKDMFDEVSYEEKDVGGTVMSIGKIKAKAPIDKGNESAIIDKALEFIEVQHPDLIIDKNSLDMSNISNGEIGFMVSVENVTDKVEEELPEEITEESIPEEISEETEGDEDIPEGPKYKDFSFTDFPILDRTAQSNDVKKN